MNLYRSILGKKIINLKVIYLYFLSLCIFREDLFSNRYHNSYYRIITVEGNS